MNRSSWAARAFRQLAAAVVTAAVCVLGYLGLLGWVRGQNVWRHADFANVYAAWQVALVVLLLAGWAVWAGARRVAFVGTVTAAVTMTACFAVDALTKDASDDGLWGVTAVAVLVGTLSGFGLVAFLSRSYSRPIRVADREG